MKVLVLATAERPSGGTFYTRRLAARLSAPILPAELPLPALLLGLLRSDADLVHMEIEYATFGSVARTLLLLPLLILLRRLRSPVVLTLHGVVTRDSLSDVPWPRLVHAAFCVSYRLSITFASAVTVHSQQMRDALATAYGFNGAIVVPLGTEIPPSVVRQPRPRELAFFGFVRPSKGLEELVDAVALLRPSYPEIHLTIAGGAAVRDQPGYAEALQARVTRSGCADCVSLETGFLGEARVEAVVTSAEALVLPYTDRYVEVSAVVHDFMGYGVPMIVSDRPRFGELTDGVDCLKVPPDPRALAAAVRRLFQDPALGQRLGGRLRETARSQSWDRVLERYRQVYADVLDGSRARAGP